MRLRLSLSILLLLALMAAPCATADDGRPRGADASTRIVVASFNVWLIPLVARAYDSRRERIPGVLRTLRLDVVAVQEAWLASDQRALAEAARPDFPHAALGGGGLMVLSRLPIRSSRFLPFPAYPGLSLPERLARKGLLEAEILTPAGPLRVVTAHLALAFGLDNPRSAQLRFLQAHLAQDTSLPTILAADLNTPPVEGGVLAAEYRALCDAGLRDAKPPVRLPGGAWDPGPPTRIGWPRPETRPTSGFWPDHILFRSAASGSLDLRSFRLALDQRATALSDHNLLRAEFILRDLRPPAKRAP